MAESNGTSFGNYTATNLDRELYWPNQKLRISITGAGGFIASHIARRLKSEGHYIIASDWKKNEHMSEDAFCDEFHLVDLRVMDNCLKVTQGAHHVFNLAADMGGMGFIQSNHAVIMYNNTMISFNMLEAARINGVSRLATLAPSFCLSPSRSSGSSFRKKNTQLTMNVSLFFTSQVCVFTEGLYLYSYLYFYSSQLYVSCRCFENSGVLIVEFLVEDCRFFYASSACIYPEFKQLETDVSSLKESDAWPALVQ